MEYKSNKIYLLLEKPIFKSDKLVFNSITGYNIIQTVQVASEEDIFTFMRNNRITRNNAILFKVNSNCEYYISRNFVAVKDTNPNLVIAKYNDINDINDFKILLFCSNDVMVTHNLGTLYKWKRIIKEFDITDKIIFTPYLIGHLSKPDGKSSLVSNLITDEIQDFNNIKLPILV